MVIEQEHRHPHTVAKSYNSQSLSFPKPAHFLLHCNETFVYLSNRGVHRYAIKKEQLQVL